jgi:hypothetical protein
LERWWWQLFWQLRRQCMPVEVMADSAVMLVGMLSEDMPLLAMLGLDTLVSVLAVDVVTNLRGPRAATPALPGARVIGMAAVTGEAVTGIRPMDILGSAITARAMAIHTTVIHTTAMAIHITGVAITVTTLTATDTGHR